jgi:hypothetical protein
MRQERGNHAKEMKKAATSPARPEGLVSGSNEAGYRVNPKNEAVNQTPITQLICGQYFIGIQ